MLKTSHSSRVRGLPRPRLAGIDELEEAERELDWAETVAATIGSAVVMRQIEKARAEIADLRQQRSDLVRLREKRGAKQTQNRCHIRPGCCCEVSCDGSQLRRLRRHEGSLVRHVRIDE